MNQLSFKITIVLFLSLSLYACKKSTSPVATKTDLITQSTWKFSTATVGGSDVSAFLQACQKDNILTFQSNGSGSVDEGLSKCNSGDLQANPFTWSFLNSETTL
ncbi:MAG TPA: hypothetical protein VET23_02585, partial [Chitinophagaceae bacterium]|nr:hypothetical protein [Chitinophagaceae bacterium]